VDEYGKPLKWDQRGNGDPRFAAGITDIGAFEQQAVTLIRVDTVEDGDLRGCTRSGGDCSLRGAITLANASPKPQVISFDRKVFADPRTLTPTYPLPEVTVDLTLDASGTGGLTLRGAFAVLRASPHARLILREVALEP
jgi:hypothetical protein